MRKELSEKLDADAPLSTADLRELLLLEEETDLQRLYEAAYRVKVRYIGKRVSLRGLIEFSNFCTKNCYYCGIRRENTHVKRYRMSLEEILREARWADEIRLGSVVLQSGERSDAEFVDFVESAVKGIKEISDGALGITLSCGEQSEETYRRWFDAGAHRYLLRIETSNPEFYRRLHPADHSYELRKNCLSLLKKVGYMTGSGVMIGVPGQTVDDLVSDLLFFRDQDLDMIGMGPYVVHDDTPLATRFPDFAAHKGDQLVLALKMIAVTRLFLKDVNIASTTALQALREDGREAGLLAGGNVIMPNITETRYRDSYQLYRGKPGLNDAPENGMVSLKKKIESIGETIAFGEWGDSPHFKNKSR